MTQSRWGQTLPRCALWDVLMEDEALTGDWDVSIEDGSGSSAEFVMNKGE